VTSVQYSADRAADSKTIGWLGRLGLVAMGVSYGLVAILAIKLAFGDGGKATSRQGALETIAHDGFGRVLVLLLAIGFAGYALWRFAQALFDRGDAGDDAKGLAKRAGYAGRGLIYAGLCVTAVAILIGAHSSGGSSGTKKETAWVLDWPAGQWIVAAAGLAVLGAGIWNIVRGLTRKFKKQLDTASMSEVEEKAATTAGVAGLLARGVVFGLVGIFLVRAAWDYDPNKAIGIDGALRKLAAQSYGDALLGVVAAGLLLFGVFCLFQARYRKV
jgi:hypothetical protein